MDPRLKGDGFRCQSGCGEGSVVVGFECGHATAGSADFTAQRQLSVDTRPSSSPGAVFGEPLPGGSFPILHRPKRLPTSFKLQIRQPTTRTRKVTLRSPRAPTPAMAYRKHFIPLESNPELFTELTHQLGLSTSLAFHDVLSLEDPDLMALIPRPALGLILVFPTTSNYEAELIEKDANTAEYSKSGEGEEVVWFKQTINNACGLYGILHAVSNGPARDFIGISQRLCLQGHLTDPPHSSRLAPVPTLGNVYTAQHSRPRHTPRAGRPARGGLHSRCATGRLRSARECRR